jgi:hypothetical protein
MENIDPAELPRRQTADHLNPQSGSGLLATPEAASYLGLGVGTLEKDRVYGRLGIPFIKMGKRVAYDRRDLEEWKRARKRCSTSERAA